MTARLLVNGVATEQVPALDRGLAYGDGLFESIRLVGTAAPLWTRHMQRLTEDCARLRIPAPDPAQLWHEALEVSRGMPQSVLRITVTRGPGERGYGLPSLPRPTRVVAAFAPPPVAAGIHAQGVRMRVCDIRLAEQPLLAGIKHLNRLEQVLARAEWNDPAIAKLNPKLPLPNMSILTVHRSDGSGTTFNFTNYLGKVNPEWQSKVGADTAVSWPGGIGGKGNAGVAASVQQTVGSIGYVEYAYAKQSKLVHVDMINAAGQRVKPTMQSFQAAAANADFSKVQDFYLILTNQPGAQSWPITAATYMLMRNDYPADKNKAILQFLSYALHDGADDAEKLDYVPFPDAVVKQIEASWATTLKVTP